MFLRQPVSEIECLEELIAATRAEIEKKKEKAQEKQRIKLLRSELDRLQDELTSL